MTNIDTIGIDKIIQQIPKGYKKLQENEVVRQNDKIAMVSITNLHKKEYQLTWHNPDSSEVGKQVKFVGQIVICAI